MLGKYTGEAYKTMHRITENIPYIPNKVYKNVEYTIYWYINRAGYLHILKPQKVRMDGKIICYTINDLLLTADNMLRSTAQNGYYKTPDNVIETLEKEVAE